jgi:hypothetical protein
MERFQCPTSTGWNVAIREMIAIIVAVPRIKRNGARDLALLQEPRGEEQPHRVGMESGNGPRSDPLSQAPPPVRPSKIRDVGRVQ